MLPRLLTLEPQPLQPKHHHRVPRVGHERRIHLAALGLRPRVFHQLLSEGVGRRALGQGYLGTLSLHPHSIP